MIIEYLSEPLLHLMPAGLPGLRLPPAFVGSYANDHIADLAVALPSGAW